MSGHDSLLGQEVVYNDETGALSHGTGGARPGGGGGGHGGTAPQPTVVGNINGLQFDLIWDSSVASAPSAFKSDVIQIATYLTTLFSTHETINVHVGWGEIGGQGLSGGALGESQTNGYLENLGALEGQLGNGNFVALNEPSLTTQIFISSAQAKAFNVPGISSSSIDGNIGFGTLGHGTSWNFNYGANGVGATTGLTQYDLQPVIFHELTEVMGRISMEGIKFNGQITYSALDMFDYNSPGMLELSSSGGYYSNDDGVTHLGNFNGSVQGGDIADWASSTSISQSGTGLTDGHQDAFDAFLWNGVPGDLSGSDVDLMHSIGFSDLIA